MRKLEIHHIATLDLTETSALWPSPESVETFNWWILVLMPGSSGRVWRRWEGAARSRGQGWP